jgi:hypothetical protein
LFINLKIATIDVANVNDMYLEAHFLNVSSVISFAKVSYNQQLADSEG